MRTIELIHFIFNDLEWPLTKILRSRHYSTLNISETVQNRDVVTMEYYTTYLMVSRPTTTLSDYSRSKQYFNVK